MSPHDKLMLSRASRAAAVVAVLFTGSAALHAQTATAADSNSVGRVEFDAPDVPKANVELNLGPEMFNDLFGIGDAAVAGVAEALAKSAEAQGADGARFAAERLAAARQIVQIVGEVVQGVRIRAYENSLDQTQTEKLLSYYDQKLSTAKWDTIVRANKDNKTATISLIRNGGAIKGIFIAAVEGDKAVLVNVLCDVSPENAKKLTSTAAESGLKAGLAQVLEQKMGKFNHGAPKAVAAPAPAAAPTPPTPPTQ